MRRLADRLVRLIAKAATFGWFRAVEVTGLERIPRTGPVLLVANHHGGFVDPALLVATVPRPVRFLAMASLFRIVPLRPLLAFAGAIRALEVTVAAQRTDPEVAALVGAVVGQVGQPVDVDQHLVCREP